MSRRVVRIRRDRGSIPVQAPRPSTAVSGDGRIDGRGQETIRAPRRVDATLRVPVDTPLQVSAMSCAALSELDPHALGLTYVFDALPEGEPYAVTIRFEGRRAGVTRRPGPRDRFDVSTTVEDVLPGSGRVAVTTRVSDLVHGQWHVVARPSVERARTTGRQAVPRLPGASGVGVTSWAPMVNVRAPGVRLGSWPAFVGLGAAAALSVQVLLAAHLHLPAARVLLVSVLACLFGLVGAKLYYLALHPAERRRALYAGMCIQGFVLTAMATLIIGVWLAGIPAGNVLCQRPSRGPRWWPSKSPHSSRVISSCSGRCLLSCGPVSCGSCRRW